jgi:hypothetical protein
MEFALQERLVRDAMPQFASDSVVTMDILSLKFGRNYHKYLATTQRMLPVLATWVTVPILPSTLQAAMKRKVEGRKYPFCEEHRFGQEQEALSSGGFRVFCQKRRNSSQKALGALK